MNKFLLAALVALGLAVPAYAAGATVSQMRFSGFTADAAFRSVDGSGCVETLVDVMVVPGTAQQTGRPTEDSAVEVFILHYDNCTFTALLSASGGDSLPVGAFQIDRKLTAASLSTTINVFDDVSMTSFPVSLSVSWTGTGVTTATTLSIRSMTLGLKSFLRGSGTTRDEVSATGTVSDGTTNLTPEPAIDAMLGSLRIGSLTITH